MSFSAKWSHDLFQKNQIDLYQVQVEPDFKVGGYQKTNYEISDAILGNNSTSNQHKQQFLDSHNPLYYDQQWFTNIYDLEQLNYRLFMNKEYERSFMIQQRLMKMNDRNQEYYHQHSLTYLALNDIDNASIQLVDDVPESFIGSIKYIQINIDCYKEQENQLIAECLFAYIVFLSQRPQKALKMIMMLITRYPKSYLPYFYASKCYYHNGDYSQSLEFINQAIMTFKYKDIQLYNLKGQILIQRQDFEDALKVYLLFPDNKYFQSQVDDLDVRIQMEKIQQENQMQRAILKKAGKKEQEFQQAGLQNINAGINYYKQRLYEESRDCFLNALQKYPNNGLCQYMLAKCYLKLGHFWDAQDHSNIAKSNYEENEKIEKLLNKIQNEIRRTDKKTYKTYQTRKFYF